MAVITLTKDNFNQEVLDSTKPVLVDFWADWCGPCKMLSPIIEQIATENDDIKVCKVNVDEQSDLADRFSVMSIPSVLSFKNGNLIETSVGVKPKEVLVAMVK